LRKTYPTICLKKDNWLTRTPVQMHFFSYSQLKHKYIISGTRFQRK